MTKTLTSASVNDNSVKFTLVYLDTIEKHLNITYTGQGEPFCLPDEITAESLNKLTRDLESLLRSEASQEAIAAAKSFGERHVQSVGFGNVSDFDAFVKIGLLHSERVVLWDILGSRILRPDRVSNTSKSVIADIACNLLLLRSVVKLGAIVVLPHPLLWSEKARRFSAEFSFQKHSSDAAVGLLFALAAIDEGMQLHPFTLTSSANPVSVGVDTVINDNVHLEKNHKFSFGLKSLMEIDDFQFLRTIPLKNFHEIVMQHPQLSRALRKQFLLLSALSSIESEQEIQAISNDLSKIFDARAKSIANYWLDGSLATASVITGAITMTSSPVGATLLGLAGITPAVFTAVRRLLARPSKDTIVHAFSDMHMAIPFSLEFITDIPDITHLESSNLDPNLIDHVSKIRNADWTEDAHRYLESLDENTAIDVLNALPPEQVDQLVNYRYRQDHYIGDYLEFIWNLNPDAFWSHIESTFTCDDGMLMYDLDGVQQVLTSEDMPPRVWMTLLKYIPSVYRTVLKHGEPDRNNRENNPYVSEFQVDQLSDVLSYQLLRSNKSEIKRDLFLYWIGHLNMEEREIVDILLLKIFSTGVPEWIPS